MFTPNNNLFYLQPPDNEGRRDELLHSKNCCEFQHEDREGSQVQGLQGRERRLHLQHRFPPRFLQSDAKGTAARN